MNEKETLYLKAKQAYYFGTPIMSDAQFDELEKEEELKNSPVLSIIGAPIPDENLLKRAVHRIHMGSQEKINNYEEFERWQRLRLNDNKELLHASYKADGGSISLYYEKGKLIEAITRGDGSIGQNITATSALFQHIPIKLNKPLSLGVRAEAILTLADWQKADPEQKTNPRNVANGIVVRLDGKKSHFISAAAFDIDFLEINNEEFFTTESEKSLFLESLGFKTTPWKGNLSLSQVQDFFEETKKLRETNKLEFWIDGLVIKYESLTKQKELGLTNNRPKGQVAWKFPAETSISIIEKIEWQVGNTGAITPVAYLTPTRIGGTTVSRASLANADNIKELGAFIGAKVSVAKAGDIIPTITKVLEKFSHDKQHAFIQIPKLCPICQSNLEKRKNVGGNDSTVIFCINPDCNAKTTGSIKRYTKSRDMLGLGDSVINSLAEEGIATKIPDLYRLTPAIENLTINDETTNRKKIKLGNKRATSILAEIQTKGTTMSLAEFLGAFGTRGLGVRRAELMIEANPLLNNFESWFDGNLLNPTFATISGVPKLGAILLEGLKEKENIIRETLQFVTIKSPEPKPPITPRGKTFCITGSLPSGKKKKEYLAPLEKNGHKLLDEVKPKLDYLVVSDLYAPESSKTKKAKKLGVNIIDETGLLLFTNPPSTNPPTSV